MTEKNKPPGGIVPHEPLGVEINGLPKTAEEWNAIPTLLEEHGGVLIISNLDVTPTELETRVLHPLARVLGHSLLPYDRWPGQSPAVTKHLALLGNYKARQDNDWVQGARKGDAIAEYKPALPINETAEWHTDGSFLDMPKSYIALYAPVAAAANENAPLLPPVGGETRFCSTRAPDSMLSEHHYDRWTTVHSWESFMRFLESRDPKRPKVTADDCAKKPDQTWPLYNGRKKGHFYLNPKNTKAVYDDKGQAVENPTAFIHDLAKALMQENGVYWHKWKPGQLVLWDNQALLHAASPFDATRYERLLLRAEFAPYRVPCTPNTVKWGYLEKSNPIATVASGSVVVVDTVTGSSQPAPDSFQKVPPELSDIQAEVKERVGPHILTGPIAIQGAEPGDVLQIDILHVRLRSDWAWTKHKASGELRHTKLTANGFAETAWGSRVECEPFFGILGVATNERVHSIPPSAAYGGNLDLKKLTAGSTLYIPVHVAGALLFVGDGHARQGDGECCGTALETSLTGTFRLTVHKQSKDKNGKPLLQSVRAETPTELIGIGVEESVDAAVTAALVNLIKWMQELSPGLSKVDAECLCSIAGDIAVTQIVNGNTRGAHVKLQKRHLPPALET